MGEIHLDLLSDYDTVIRPTFNGAVRVEAREERLTADAGAILMREVMDRIRVIEPACAVRQTGGSKSGCSTRVTRR